MKTILESIGNTPIIELKKINPHKDVKILVKLEGANPGGSIKDRPAYWMIKKAIEDGSLTKDKTILEPTSGNTGIALAMVGAALGYKVTLVMPACVSVERQKVLEALGAETILTPGCDKTDGAIRKSHKILEENPEKYFMPNQFVNPNNAISHYETTGPEIWEQTDGKIDAFIAGLGTSGTLMGIGRYLKEKNPKVKIVAVEPTLGHKIQGLKNMEESIVPEIYDKSVHDEVIIVEDDHAFDITRRLALEEGLFVGMSSGAAVAGAIKLAEKIGKGTIVTVLPDRGDRYLSTTLFKSICAECPP